MIENIDAFAQFVSYEKFRRHEGLSPFIYYREAGYKKAEGTRVFCKNRVILWNVSHLLLSFSLFQGVPGPQHCTC